MGIVREGAARDSVDQTTGPGTVWKEGALDTNRDIFSSLKTGVMATRDDNYDRSYDAQQLRYSKH